MKRKFVCRSFMGVLLALALSVTLISPAFAATDSNVKKYTNMFIFGDSIMCADELPTTGYFKPVVDSWTTVLAQRLGLDDYTSIAFHGARAIDGLYLLGSAPKNYDELGSKEYITKLLGTKFWNNYLNVAAGNDPVVGNPREKCAAADLILIQTGNNDTSGYTINMTKTDIRKALFSLGSSDLTKFLSNAAELPAGLAETAALLSECIVGFDIYYDKLIKEIKSINSTADIVLVGSYNPFENISLFDGNEEIAIGNLLAATTKTVNAIIEKTALKYGCIYVDIFGVGAQFPVQSILGGLGSVPLHPTVAGHKWIAAKVLEALPSTEKRVLLPRNGELRLAFGSRDAGIYELSRKGVFWSISDPASGKFVSLDPGMQLRMSDCSDLWFYNGGFYRLGFVKVDSRFGHQYLRFARTYLSANDDGTLAAVSSRSNVTMFVPAP